MTKDEQDGYTPFLIAHHNSIKIHVYLLYMRLAMQT